MKRIAHLTLPDDLLGIAEHFDSYAQAESLVIGVSSSCLDQSPQVNAKPEVIAIQRLLTLTRHGIPIRVIWDERVAAVVFQSPPLFPLLAVVICLENATHEVTKQNGTSEVVNVLSSRELIYKHRLQTDLFSDSQILLCADSTGHGRQKSLYSSRSGSLISREDFGSLVERLMAGQVALNVSDTQAVVFSQNVATIVAELFENTDLHGRFTLKGNPIQVNGMRGIVFKRIKIDRKEKHQARSSIPGDRTADAHPQNRIEVAALEISVFDSGVGFYPSFTRSELTLNTSIDDEWHVMHKCLARHYDEQSKDTPLFSDARPAHRCMGLYEVLRALMLVEGKIEVRSGRAYGYRTFLKGDPKYQRESQTSKSRPGMPKPALLDVEHQFFTAPHVHELLSGASLRVIVPLQ